MKFDIQTRLAIDKGGGDAVKAEFKKVTDGARQASIDVKDLTKSIGAGISIFAIARQNLQALAPVLERNGQLFREWAVGMGANEGAVKGLTLAMDSLIHPSRIIENAIAATEEGSRQLADALVGETRVVLNLSEAKLKEVEAYRAGAEARAIAGRAADAAIPQLEFELEWATRHVEALEQGAEALRDWAADRAAAAFVAKHPLASPDVVKVIRELNLELAKQAQNEDAVRKSQEAGARAAEERRRANERYLQDLQAIQDRLHPVAAAERDLLEQIAIVSRAMAEGGTSSQLYAGDLAELQRQLESVRTSAELVARTIQLIEMPDRLTAPSLNENPYSGGQQPSLTIEAVDTAASRYNEAFEDANKQLAAGLEFGLTSAFSSALVEFAKGGEDAFKHFGDAMLDVLLNAVAEWLAAQLAAIAKAAIASKAISGGSGTGVSGTTMGQGAITSGGSASSGAMTAFAVVAVMAGLVAYLKHESDRAAAVRYDTTAGVRYDNGAMTADSFGKLSESGPAVANALNELLGAFQSATGSFIEGIVTAEVQIRNDKTAFRAIVNGVMIGQFKTAEEAIIAAAKGAFLASDLSKQLDPIIRTMIESYQGKDPQELFKAIDSVQGIIDDIAGLTEIEVALRNIPQQSAALANELTGMGVAFDDAARLANDWRANELNNLRDQITGHQKTAAEEMAERQRQAVMFNAQVELLRAETTLKRDELAMRVAALQGAGEVLEADLAIKQTELSYQQDYLQRKVDVFEQDVNVHEWYLTTLGTIGNTSLEILQTMIAALDAQLANLPDLIMPGDIRRRGGRGGGHGGGHNTPTGPTPEEIAAQLAEDIAAFWEDIAATWRSIIPGVGGQIRQLNHWYEEQAARARELGIPLDELNHLYAQQLLNLQNETLGSLGLQSVETIQQFRALRDALKHLREWGMLTEAQLRELGDSMYISLVDSLLQYVDNEEVRAQLEDLRFRMEMANYELQFQMLLGLGILTQAEIDVITGLLAGINEAYLAGELDFQVPERRDRNRPQRNDRDDARERAIDALRQALDRLRGAVEGLREFQEGLTLSSASPLTTSQQFDEAARQYAELLARAQGGDVGAMEELAAAAQRYLDLAAQMYGTSGAGYAAIFDLVSQQIAAIVAAGQAILDAAPAEMQGTEDRLDTIAEILAEIRRLYGGGRRSNGAASMPSALPNAGANRSLGSVGNLSLGNFSGSGTLTVRDPELVAQVRALAEAQAAATVEAKADRMKKPAVGLSGFYGTPIGGRRSA